MLPLGVVNLVAVAIITELQHPDHLGANLNTFFACVLGWVLLGVSWVAVAMCSPLMTDNRPHDKIRKYEIDPQI